MKAKLQVIADAMTRLQKAARSICGWNDARVYRCPFDEENIILHDGYWRAASVPIEVVFEVGVDNKLGMTGLAVELVRRAKSDTGPLNKIMVPLLASPDDPDPVLVNENAFDSQELVVTNGIIRAWKLYNPNKETPPMSEQPTETSNERSDIYESGWNAAQANEPRSAPVFTDPADEEAWFKGYDDYSNPDAPRVPQDAQDDEPPTEPSGKVTQGGPESDDEEVGPETADPEGKPADEDTAEAPQESLCVDVFNTLCGLIGMIEGAPEYDAMRQYLLEARNVCPEPK